MKKITLGLLTIWLLTFSSCNCEFLKLCNLALSTIKLVNPIVNIGVSFLLDGFIKNKTEEVCNKKQNNGNAPASKESRSVEYRADDQEPWTTAYFGGQNGPIDILVTDVPPVTSGGNVTEQHEFKFNTPGQYRFAGEEDYPKVIEETNEQDNYNNTQNSSENGQLSNKNDLNPIKDDGIVRVYDPSGQVKPVYNNERKVVIEFIGVKTIATNTK